MPANAPKDVVRQHEMSIATVVISVDTSIATLIYNLLYFSPVFVMFYFLLMLRDNSLFVCCQGKNTFGKKLCLFGSEGGLHLQKVVDPCLVVVKTVFFCGWKGSRRCCPGNTGSLHVRYLVKLCSCR